MTGKQIEKYIRNELDSEPKHDCEALSKAINEVADEVEFDSFRIMQLLLENKPIGELHTHSYSFQTANGREIINTLIDKYHEYESTN